MLWLLTLPIAVHILRNRDKYSNAAISCSVGYFLGHPIVLYDYFIYSNMEGGLNWIMTQEPINMIFRYTFMTCGLFLMYKSLKSIYRKLHEKKENKTQ